ncbi:hypothetical protein QJQ45_002590 [Haematococcus lacustris]|nr:hypothetical protein QJQ45_002590 [Haematococcus lacustris]
MAEVSMERHGRTKQLVVFFGAASIGTKGGWGADAMVRACCKVMCRPRGSDQLRGRVVLVDEHRTTQVSLAVNGQQPCEEERDHEQPTRRAGWKPPAGQVDLRLLRLAWSQQRDQPCPPASSSQEATPAAASEPGPSTPPPAKRSKRTKAEQAAELSQGNAASAKPAPQPGRWLDRDCNAALNMQRFGESRASRSSQLHSSRGPRQGGLKLGEGGVPGQGQGFLDKGGLGWGGGEGPGQGEGEVGPGRGGPGHGAGWAAPEQKMRLHGAQEKVLERYCKKLEDEAAVESQKRWGTRKQLVVFFGNAGIGTRGGWGAKAVLQACRKVVERANNGKPTDRVPGKVVTVDEFCTSRVSSAMNSPQPCEAGPPGKPTRLEGLKPQPGQVQNRLLRSAWSKRFEAPVRGLMWCPQLHQATPGDLGKWVDRDCNAALNMQRAGESKWRPLELCRLPHRARLPAKGKEYPTLGFKKLRDRGPKAQAQQPVAQ